MYTVVGDRLRQPMEFKRNERTEAQESKKPVQGAQQHFLVFTQNSIFCPFAFGFKCLVRFPRQIKACRRFVSLVWTISVSHPRGQSNARTYSIPTSYVCLELGYSCLSPRSERRNSFESERVVRNAQSKRVVSSLP